MPAHDISYETRGGRCCWCWEPMSATESHTVVRARSSPPLELRFHHRCWPTYLALSGLQARPVGVAGDWPPERLERLRLHNGMDVRTFAARLGVTEHTLRRILCGDSTALGPGVEGQIKHLAVQSRFERSDPVDWTQGEAVFCFRMERGWNLSAMAIEVGCSAQQLQLWQWSGVPERSVRTHGRLSTLARKYGFDAGMILPHRLWTHEFLREVMDHHGERYPVSAWALAGRVNQGTLRQWLRGERNIVPESAWHLTRAAITLGLPLPPEGLVPLRKGAWAESGCRLTVEQLERRKRAQQEARWSLDTLRLLGTLPDRELARQLGRSRNSVSIMRRELDIPVVDVRDWDGQPRPQTVSDEELQRRWQDYRQRVADAKRQYYERREHDV